MTQPVTRKTAPKTPPKTAPKTAPKIAAKNTWRLVLPWWLGAVVITLLDQLSKIMILRTFHDFESVPITSFFNLVLVYNSGAAFSFLADASGWQRWLFIGIGGVAISIMSWLLARHYTQKLFASALMLLMGGAVGNIIDRVLYGHVVDFLDFYWQHWHFPAFNVADSAICVGAFLLIIDELKRVKQG
jgi:signal peptidase II